MVSFHRITVGQQVEFNRILADAGFTKKDVEAVIANPRIAESMLHVLKAYVSESEFAVLTASAEPYLSQKGGPARTSFLDYFNRTVRPSLVTISDKVSDCDLPDKL